MVMEALTAALFGALVTVLYCLIMAAFVMAVTVVGVILGFFWHLWDNRKSARIAKGE